MSSQHKTPVTLLTGFLGAGKTTLLNHFLQSYKSKRFIILENEYGEIGIDSSIVRNNEKAWLYEMNDGCMCCSLKDELSTVLERVIEIRKDFDHVIVEATGIANPGDIIKSFVDGQVAPDHFYIDSVICLVDAQWFMKQFEQHNELRRQVAQSDIILVNKIDLAEPEQLNELVDLVKQINPFAQIYMAEYGMADDVNLLEAKAYQPKSVEGNIVDFKSINSGLLSVQQNQHRIKSHSFTIEGSIDLDKFNEWIKRFMYVNTGNIFRIKGILNCLELNHKVIVQSVYDQCKLEGGSDWDSEEERRSTIVFIGMELYEKRIKEELEGVVRNFD